MVKSFKRLLGTEGGVPAGALTLKSIEIRVGGVPQVRLPNVVFGLQIVLGLSKWAKSPFGRFRTETIDSVLRPMTR